MCKISVIIPCYNQANYLHFAIESIIAQTYYDWECIIVNDGSSDNTEQIAQEFMKKDSRINYIYQNNQGLPGARNTGLKLAKGEYIQLLDSDDTIANSKFEKQIKVMNNNQAIDIVYSNYAAFTDAEQHKHFCFFDRQEIQEDALNDFVFNYEKEFITPIHIYLFRKACFEKWGYYDDKLKNYEDWDLYLRFAYHKPIYYYINETLAYYRRNTNGICANTSTTNNWRIKVINKHLQSEHLNEIQKKQLKFTLHDFIGKLGFEYIKIGEYRLGLKYIYKAMRLSGKYFYYTYNASYWLKQQIFK